MTLSSVEVIQCLSVGFCSTGL